MNFSLDIRGNKNSYSISRCILFIVLNLFLFTYFFHYSFGEYLIEPVFFHSEYSKSITNFLELVEETNRLSIEYQINIGKWMDKNYTNTQMVNITDEYSPKLQDLIYKFKEMVTDPRLQNLTDLYTKSIEYEIESNSYFKDFLLTNNSKANETSINLLSKGYEFEKRAFDEFYRLNPQK